MGDAIADVGFAMIVDAVVGTGFEPADAVVGTGFKLPLRGSCGCGRLASSTPVVAVDLPSGWDADSMEQNAEGAFRADAVVTFTAPKMAHVFGHLTDGAATFGPVVVAEIGSPAEAVTFETMWD